METKIIKFQTAFFTKNFNILDDASRAQFLLDINRYSGQIFNAPPVQVPVPNDAPPEIPRIILNNIDNRFNCNITLSRTDLLFNIPNDNTQSLINLLRIQRDNSDNIFSFLLSKNVVINRIGFVAIAEKILSPDEGSGFIYLKNNFIKDNKFNEPKELIFRYNRVDNSENFEMNNVITINGKSGNKIILQTDVNTSAELMLSAIFNTENFNEIIDYSIEKTQGFINNFPNI